MMEIYVPVKFFIENDVVFNNLLILSNYNVVATVKLLDNIDYWYRKTLEFKNLRSIIAINQHWYYLMIHHEHKIYKEYIALTIDFLGYIAIKHGFEGDAGEEDRIGSIYDQEFENFVLEILDDINNPVMRYKKQQREE